ncbi:MAG: SDR family NAD(P)-dependent oxidoreductase, partial [Planctomycetota bacterium]
MVTGASRGIGEAIVEELSAHWPEAVFSLVARGGERLEAVARRDPGRRRALPADLSEPDAVAPLVEAAHEAWGPVDVLINNAGLYLAGPTAGLDPEAFERLLAVNVRSPWRLTRAVLPSMLERADGTIVDVASVAAFAPVPGTPHYSGSKAALGGASEALYGELRRSGVHVLTVYPGPIHTDMGAQAQRALGGGAATRLVPWGTPEG